MGISQIVAALVLGFGAPQGPPDAGKAWVGNTAASVVVKDEDGKSVDLARQFGKAPVVLVFYRGVW